MAGRYPMLSLPAGREGLVMDARIGSNWNFFPRGFVRNFTPNLAHDFDQHPDQYPDQYPDQHPEPNPASPAFNP